MRSPWWFVAYIACQAIPTALLLAYLIGSLLFAGGQAFPDARSTGGVLEYPIFVVPAWLVIVPAAIGLVLVWWIVAGESAGVARAAAVFGLSAAATLANWMFAYAFPIHDGVLQAGDGVYAGYHLIACALTGVTTIVLAVYLAINVRAYERARRDEIKRRYLP